MIIQTEDYKIEYIENEKAILSGELRLPSPTSYEQPFTHIKDQLENTNIKTYSIDLSNLTFLNSSGITALARIIILARNKEVPMSLIIKDDIPWQKKTITSLIHLWDQVEIKSA
jgi:hypothetical protein